MAILAASALLTIGILQDLLSVGSSTVIMSLLRAVLSRVAAIQDEVMEVSGATDAVHLLNLVPR